LPFDAPQGAPEEAAGPVDVQPQEPPTGDASDDEQAGPTGPVAQP
jgi:hypothetical protein